MIELISKNSKKYSVDSVDEIVDEKMDFIVIQFHDYTEKDTDWLRKNFNLDFPIMSHYEDIEISSHLLESANQISFHFSMPYYNKTGKMVDEPVFVIISSSRIFLFTSSVLDKYLSEIYATKFLDIAKLVTQDNGILKFPFEFITDYYADITENLAKKIKSLANKVLVENVFTGEDMNLITTYSFNNLLIKEAVNETIRIFNLCKKSNFGKTEVIKEVINTELDDLVVVSDYIQFNLERLRDLRDHINNKIDFDQNRIFKILTVATICIALPTLVGGIYGMNFEIMPELQWRFGYPLAILVMILCAILPYFYFKRKKWF
jgi:magnesium transporter